MSEFSLESFKPEMATAVIPLLARAFVPSPLHVRALGANQYAKNEVLFRSLFAFLKGPKDVVIEDGRIIGFSHWVHSPQCQPAGLAAVRMVPSLIFGVGLLTSLRLVNWISTWSKHDPKEPHSHLGPIGVEPSSQGKGIGGLLMKHYCAELDRDAMTGYLETDSPENVQFYSRFGFKTINEIPVLGMTNYLMRREIEPIAQ